MRKPWKKILALGLAAVLAASWSDAALAKHKKHRAEHRTSSGRSGDLGIKRDYDGTPIIMQGYHRRSTAPSEPERRADRPVRIPRGSSTYIPPPVPSPYAPNSPPARALTQPVAQPYNPPPITTFSDRVTGAIHAYPLDKGIGNNPTDQQMFIRQRINQ
jgi:hypothetical protein